MMMTIVIGMRDSQTQTEGREYLAVFQRSQPGSQAATGCFLVVRHLAVDIDYHRARPASISRQ